MDWIELYANRRPIYAANKQSDRHTEHTPAASQRPHAISARSDSIVALGVHPVSSHFNGRTVTYTQGEVTPTGKVAHVIVAWAHRLLIPLT